MVFVDLFSGCGRFSAAFSCCGAGAQEWDLKHGQKYAMGSSAEFHRMWNALASLLRDERLLGVRLAPVCTTWSIARRPVVRSRHFLWGLPGLNEKDAAQTKTANRCIRNELKLIDWLLTHNVPCSIENPQSSKLWMLRFFRWHMAQGRLQKVVAHFCQFNESWRKATTFLCAGLSAASTLSRLCIGRKGMCSARGKAHQQLSGSHPQLHIPWTKVSEPYRVALCSALSSI